MEPINMPYSQYLISLCVAFLLAGFGGGFLAGLLGVGGGIVIVPVLYHVFGYLHVPEDVRMHVAVGTSLATIMTTSISSWRSHAKRDAVDIDLLKRWAPTIIGGAIAGGFLAAYLHGGALTLIFAVVATAVSIQMAFVPERFRVAEQLPKGAAGKAAPFLLGAVSATMGIGGGTLSVPFLSLFSYPIHRAVGTASAFGLMIAVPGTIAFIIGGWHRPDLPPYSLGYVNLVGFAVIATLSYVTAPWGARAAHAVSRSTLRKFFALFLAITAARMIFGLIHG
jgi:uncharacterized membrane protein YfcA